MARGLIFLGMILFLGGARADPSITPRSTLAVIDFDYFDTSGEARDQSGDHARRMQEFMTTLRRDLAQQAGYHVVEIDCGGAPCVVGSASPAELFEAAKRAGARFILFGGVHKMSTLVQWAKTQLVDVEDNRLVDERWLSFRGDDDQSWRRAEAYLATRLARSTTKR